MPDRDDSENPKGRLLFTDFDLSNKGRPPGVSLDLVSNPRPEPVENELFAKPLQTLDDFQSTMDLSFEADDEVAEDKPTVNAQDEEEEAFPDDEDDDPVIELDAHTPPAPDRRKTKPDAEPPDAFDEEPDEREEKPVVSRRKAPHKKLRKRAPDLEISPTRRRRRRPGGKTAIRPAQPLEETPPAQSTPEASTTVTAEDFVAEPAKTEQYPHSPAKTDSIADSIPASNEESGSFLDEEVEYMPSSSGGAEADLDPEADDLVLASDEETVYDSIPEHPAATDDLAPVQTMQVLYEDLEDSAEDALEATTSFPEEEAEFRDATVTDDVPDGSTQIAGEDDIEELFDSIAAQTEGSTTTTAFTGDFDDSGSNDEVFDKEQNEWVTTKSSRHVAQEEPQDDADIEQANEASAAQGLDREGEDDIESFLDGLFPEDGDTDDVMTATDQLQRPEAAAEPVEDRVDTGAAAYDVDEEDIADLLDDMFGDKTETPHQVKAGEDEDFDTLLELDEEDFAKAIAADEETAAAAVYKTTASLGMPDSSTTAVDESAEQDELLDSAGITEYLKSIDAEEDEDDFDNPDRNEADLLAPDSEIWDLFNPNIPTEEILPPQDESQDVFASFDSLIDTHDDLLSIVPPDVVPPREPESEQQPVADAPAEDVSSTNPTRRFELPAKDTSTQSDFSGRLPVGPDSTVVMDKPHYDQLFKDLKQKKRPKTRKLSNRWQDTEDLFSSINLKKEWEERIRKYQEKTKNTREEDADKILSDLDNMPMQRATYPSASETDTNYDFFRNTVDFDPDNPAAHDVAGPEEDDILSALLEEEKETADKLAAEGELASLLADLENDKPEVQAKAEDEAEYEIEPESVAELNWEEDSQSAPPEGEAEAEAEPEAEQAAPAETEAKAQTDTSDGTDNELNLDRMVSAAGWETGEMPAIPDEPPEEEAAEYKHYGPERTAPDDDDDFSSKVRQADGRAGGDEDLEELVEGLGDGEEETPAEPAEEEIAVNPMDVFANMDDFDDFEDDGLDDDMKAMLADGDEDGDGEAGEEADGEAGAAAVRPLPPGFKGKVISLLRFLGEKVGRFLPLDKLKNAWQAIGFRENWRFYIDLVAALIATASVAVIVSYFMWYR